MRRLGSLYDKTTRVVVWLGNDGVMDEPCPEIGWLAGAPRSLCSAGNLCHMGRGVPAANQNAPDKTDRHWGGVNEFLKRPWFTRAWIVQELALGGDT